MTPQAGQAPLPSMAVSGFHGRGFVGFVDEARTKDVLGF